MSFKRDFSTHPDMGILCRQIQAMEDTAQEQLISKVRQGNLDEAQVLTGRIEGLRLVNTYLGEQTRSLQEAA